MRIRDAKEMAEESGYTFTYTHSHTDMDFTSQIPLDPEFYDTWLIMGVESVDTKNKTATLLVISEENQQYLESKEQQQATLEGKFPKADAWAAMEKYGKDNYPKFNLKEMGNEIAATARSDSAWFLKTYCTYTDKYGVKWKDKIVEAQISGTPDNPSIDYFYIYP